MKRFKVEANIKLYLTEEDLEDIFVTALESGIGHWAIFDDTGKEYDEAPYDEPSAITAFRIMLNGGQLHMYDIEEADTHYYLDFSSFLHGIGKWLEQRHFCEYSELLGYDAIDADMIIQYAVFDEIVFG